MRFDERLGLFLARCVQRMPYSLIVRTGRLLGWCFYLFSRRDRKVAKRNIEACFPELEAKKQQTLTRESLIQLGSNALEGLWVWTHPPDEILNQVIRVEGHERVTRTLDSGRGVIIMIAHLGQWEVLATYLGRHFQGTFLARSFGKPALDKLVTDGRESAGGHVEYVSRSGLKNIYQTTREGGLVAMLTDQQPERRHGVFAPFFNIPTLTTMLIQDLAAQTGAEVITATLLRRPGGGYDLVFGEPEPGLDSDDKITAASALNLTYERMIRRCPEQYSWNYKRFKRRPNPGEKPFYG